MLTGTPVIPLRNEHNLNTLPMKFDDDAKMGVDPPKRDFVLMYVSHHTASDARHHAS